MKNRLLLCGVALLLGACNPVDVQSQEAKNDTLTMQQRLIERGMSTATEIILTRDKEFCSDESRGMYRRTGAIRQIVEPEIMMRDLAVNAICLDASDRGHGGHDLAMDTALVAQAVGKSFEYENLLYSMIATSPKSSSAEKAWAYHLLASKKLTLVMKRSVPFDEMQSIARGGSGLNSEIFFGDANLRHLER